MLPPIQQEVAATIKFTVYALVTQATRYSKQAVLPLYIEQ